jgi:hypothetical protein
MKWRSEGIIAFPPVAISTKVLNTLYSIEMLRSYEFAAHIHHISPTPLLMTVADNDTLTPTDLALKAYSQALEPKELHLLPGGHFDGYSGPNFERNAGRQVEFLKKTLCSWSRGLKSETFEETCMVQSDFGVTRDVWTGAGMVSNYSLSTDWLKEFN